MSATLERCRSWMSRLIDHATDLLWPPRCVLCQADLAEGPSRVQLCDACRAQFAPRDEPRCSRCGAATPTASLSNAPCYLCCDVKLHFDGVHVLGQYTGALQRAILRSKHAYFDSLGVALGHVLSEHVGPLLTAMDWDAIVPVPMHWTRRWSRGTNVTELLGDALALATRIPLERRALHRTRRTALQSLMTPHQRWDNVRGAFSASRGLDLRQARIVLVDDILTTGATCSEAAATLKRAGAATVRVVALARAQGSR